LTVHSENGAEHTYDPRRLQGVTIYREVEQKFSVGDRVQFTAPDKELEVANRELGTVENLNERGEIGIRLDSGRLVECSIDEHRHLDLGYEVTSHSSQGLTAERALLHIDTEHSHPDLIKTRLAYVAVSRGQFDVQIFTDNTGRLSESLGHEVSKSSAMEFLSEEIQNIAQDAGEASPPDIQIDKTPSMDGASISENETDYPLTLTRRAPSFGSSEWRLIVSCSAPRLKLSQLFCGLLLAALVELFLIPPSTGAVGLVALATFEVRCSRFEAARGGLDLEYVQWSFVAD